MVQFDCDSLIFHFNKKHLQDATVPMWVIKAKGKTYYINHVTADIPWTTKETPDNTHTKGSLKFKKCRCLIDENNDATITKIDTANPIENKEKPHRILITGHNTEILKGIEHSEIKYYEGACGTDYSVCDILNEQDLTLLTLKHHNSFRILQENELYYKWYDGNDADEYEDE